MEVTSPAFAHGGEMPRRHTCDGDDVSPPLRFAGVPEEARSLALLVDDPDAPGRTFTHWLAWGIGADAPGLGEGEPAPREGRNDFGAPGYRGPCPPPGHGAHRYVFRLHALDTQLEVEAKASRRDLERAIVGHVLETAELVGSYGR
jgi:Raf kinase inhibitor-like YbhB/YbcL family protein